MSQAPFNIDPNQSSHTSDNSSSTHSSAPISDEQMAAENTYAVRSAMRSNAKPNFNQWAFGLVPVLIGAGIFVACTSHKEAAVEATTSASVAADTKTEKYPDENLDGFDAVKKGKGKHTKGAHGAKTARRAPVDNVYVVQIGAFRVKQNAEKLNEKLKSAGYPVELQQIEHSSNGQLFLVRLNPMNDRHTAEDMRMNLKAKIDIDSMILAVPKTERAVSSMGTKSETSTAAPTHSSGSASANVSGHTSEHTSGEYLRERSTKDGEREAARSDSRNSEIR